MKTGFCVQIMCSCDYCKDNGYVIPVSNYRYPYSDAESKKTAKISAVKECLEYRRAGIKTILLDTEDISDFLNTL